MSKELGYWEEDNELPCTVYRFCNSEGIELFSMTEYKDKDSHDSDWSLTYGEGGFHDLGDWNLEEAKHQALLFMYGKLQVDMKTAKEWIEIIESMENKDE